MLCVYCTCIYVYFSRILSIACGPSTSTFAFAAAASSSHHHMGSSFLTSSLTSPGLPSSRVLTNEMTQFSRPGVIGRSGSSSLRKGELPTAGGVFIWDLKTQKQKVFIVFIIKTLVARQLQTHTHTHTHTHSAPSLSSPSQSVSTAWPSTTTATCSSLEEPME